MFPLVMKPVVSFQGADAGCRADAIKLTQQPLAGPGVGAAVLPGGFDQQLTGVGVPALVIGPWCRDWPEEFSLGTSPR